MAIRRLVTMVQTFASGADPQTVRNDLPIGRGPIKNPLNQVGVARVLAVGAALTIVQHQGQTVQVGQATDEPLRAGQTVFVTPVRGGGLAVLGSQRG
jgi:hypothetical protein